MSLDVLLSWAPSRPPKLGIIVPGMGTTTTPCPTGLAGALFSPVQQRVLGLLFGQPDRRFQSAEVIRLAGSGTGATHRVLTRLTAAGLVDVTRTGNQKHYQANRSSPVFAELRGLVVKTVGLLEPLRRALAPRAAEIRAAFVYGSVAKGTDTSSSDVDLLVVSESLGYQELFEALQAVEEELARPVNPNVLSLEEWRAQKATAASFMARVNDQPRLFVIGSEDDLA